MTYPEWMAARQLLTEERFGALIRQSQKDEADEFTRAARLAPRG
jgi:hypothetical protein